MEGIGHPDLFLPEPDAIKEIAEAWNNNHTNTLARASQMANLCVAYLPYCIFAFLYRTVYLHFSAGFLIA